MRIFKSRSYFHFRLPHMRARRHLGRRTFLFRAVCVLISVSILLILIDARLRPFVCDSVSAAVKNETVYEINSAAAEVLSENELKYSQLADIRTDESGNINAVTVSAAAVNEIKSKITMKLTESAILNEFHIHKLPLGTLFNSVLTNGRGPYIKVRSLLNNFVVSDIKSSFESAGINQTRHRIYLVITANIGVQVSLYQTTESLATEVLIAETVIVGNVPSAFSDFGNKD